MPRAEIRRRSSRAARGFAANVRVGPYVVIEEEAEIAAGTEIDAFLFGTRRTVGEDCRLHPRVTIFTPAGAHMGNRVEVHSGAVIGGDGFGYVFGEGRFWKFPQVGNLVIGDDVEIGCNTTIDRGSRYNGGRQRSENR